jgi:amino acid transporter
MEAITQEDANRLKDRSGANTGLHPLPRLRARSLGPWAVLGQSIANIGPSGAPLISIPVVASIAGSGSWVSFLIATIGVVLIAVNINAFACDSSGTASLYHYIARSLGTTAGVLGGWALAIAYIGCGAACVPLVAYFLSNLLEPLHFHFSSLLISTALLLLVWYCAWKDMRLSAHLMLGVEFSAMAVGTALAAAILFKHGSHFDVQQFQLHRLSATAIGQASVLAFYATVGFESAASLGDEARSPLKNIPRAITVSCLIAGVYFILHAYTMVAGMRGLSLGFSDSRAPVMDVARAHGVSYLAYLLTGAGLVSVVTIVLASINAGARTLLLLAQHGVLPEPFRRIHAKNHTPSTAITTATIIALLVTTPLIAAGVSARDIWGYVGSICTFGFLLAYLLITIGTPFYLHRRGRLRPSNLLVAALGSVVVSVPFIASLYPVPAYPRNLMIYIFLAIVLAGMGWFLALRTRRPGIVGEIEAQLAATYDRFAAERASGPDAARWDGGAMPLVNVVNPENLTSE